ncbi:ORF6N domain-containing protein [Olivibacter sp. XZL3]|uniref:ORF6N domain-containing protein n=1 Tax=Olivibacter sp. XZL3 TaxID=1735116 RepID=UPI00197DB549
MRQVRRNLVRFPSHFMFELSREEYQEIIRSQNATLEQGAYSRYLPFAFTEHGLLMLSNVLKSERAISMTIRIIDVFVKMREMLANHTELYGIRR